MAESCPSSNISNLSTEVSSIGQETEQSKQDCTSPSPTETVCLDSLCNDTVAGKSYLFYILAGFTLISFWLSYEFLNTYGASKNFSYGLTDHYYIKNEMMRMYHYTTQ